MFRKYEITDLQWQKGTVERVSIIPLRYEMRYPEKEPWNTLSDMDWTEWGNYEAAQLGVIKDALELHLKSSSLEYSDSDIISINMDNRYQVRCVKE